MEKNAKNKDNSSGKKYPVLSLTPGRVPCHLQEALPGVSMINVGSYSVFLL